MKFEQEQRNLLCRLYLDTSKIQMSIKLTSELLWKITPLIADTIINDKKKRDAPLIRRIPCGKIQKFGFVRLCYIFISLLILLYLLSRYLAAARL